MKRRYIISAIAVLPSLILILLAFWRKDAQSSTELEISTPQPGITAYRIEPGKLRNTESIWLDRKFLEVKKEIEIRSLLQDNVRSLSLSENAKADAENSCWSILKGYGLGDWDTFKSARVPIEGYGITQLARTLIKTPTDASSEDLMEIYHSFWNKTFQSNALFAEVSIPTNAVVLINLPLNEIQHVSFPQFTDPRNQNWVSISPPNFFDYTGHLTNSNELQALRFSFFGRRGREVNMYLLVFLWDDDHSAWLPWRLQVALTRKPSHKIIVF